MALELAVLLNVSESGSNSFKMLTLTLFSSSGCTKSIKFRVSVLDCVSIFNLLSDLAGEWECVEDVVDNLELAEELLGNTRGGGGVGWFLGGSAGGVWKKNYFFIYRNSLNHHLKKMYQVIHWFLHFPWNRWYQIKIHLTTNKSKSIGSDDIQIEFVKLCCRFLLPCVTHIENECLRNSTFPNTSEMAYHKPIPKVANPEIFKDIMPISVLPALSKLLEKEVNDQLRRYLDNNNILPCTQSGFRLSQSCNTALLNVTDCLYLCC